MIMMRRKACIPNHYTTGLHIHQTRSGSLLKVTSDRAKAMNQSITQIGLTPYDE